MPYASQFHADLVGVQVDGQPSQTDDVKSSFGHARQKINRKNKRGKSSVKIQKARVHSLGQRSTTTFVCV